MILRHPKKGWLFCSYIWGMAKKKKTGGYKADPRNYNKGTAKGAELIGRSLRENGIGRPVLVARDNTIIAGNKTIEQLRKGNGEQNEVVEVETDGSELVVTRRTDISGPDDPKFKRLAMMDNATAEANLEWDYAAIESDYEAKELEEVDVKLATFLRHRAEARQDSGGDLLESNSRLRNLFYRRETADDLRAAERSARAELGTESFTETVVEICGLYKQTRK